MQFELENTGERRATRPSSRYSIIKSPEPPKRIGCEYYQERYRLSATARTSFFSNLAQLPLKRAVAERGLREFMYSDVIDLAREIQLESSDSRIFELAGKMIDVMINGSEEG